MTPQQSCGALKTKTELLFLMILYIPTYEIRGYLVPNGSNKISVAPKLTAPKLFLNLWKFLEYHLGRNTLHNLDYPSRRIPRRSRQKQMYMIIFYFHRIYLKLIPLGYLLKDYLKPFRQIPLQYHLPIFRNPYYVILEIIDRMTCSLNRAHARVIPRFIAFGDPVFIRLAKLSGIQRAFLIKPLFLHITRERRLH